MNSIDGLTTQDFKEFHDDHPEFAKALLGVAPNTSSKEPSYVVTGQALGKQVLLSHLLHKGTFTGEI
ncbi:MAG TPA: hypothetical protein VGB77_06605, partial [Abditibacteriaceae bacterium]